MQEVSFTEALDSILARDPRYDREGYAFVRQALDRAQKAIGKDEQGRPRHVTGQQLLLAIRDFGLAQFGPMAITVFEEWGIHQCSDFGEIVFNMVEAEWLGKTPPGSRGDFRVRFGFFRGLPPSLFRRKPRGSAGPA